MGIAVDNPTLLWEMTLRLVLSALFGAMIGFERETHGRPAGLRTHIIVCLGSTLFTLCSYLVAGKGNDPGRITAQIVTGIGFLGAGTIIHQGSVVRGLTTAASVWTVAAIGVGVGIGGIAFALSAVTAVIVYVTLNYVPKLERYITTRRDERIIAVTVPPGQESVACILSAISSNGARLAALTREYYVDRSAQVVTARIHIPRSFDEDSFCKALSANECVMSYRWL